MTSFKVFSRLCISSGCSEMYVSIASGTGFPEFESSFFILITLNLRTVFNFSGAVFRGSER